MFPLIDAVCRNEKNRAFDLLSEYKEVDDTPLGFLTLLYNNIRQILMVQGLGDNKDVASRTGLTGYQVKLAMEKMGRYSHYLVGFNEYVQGLRQYKVDKIKNLEIIQKIINL